MNTLAWKVVERRADGTWHAVSDLIWYRLEALERLRRGREACEENARRRDYGQPQDPIVLGLQRFEVLPLPFEPEIVLP